MSRMSEMTAAEFQAMFATPLPLSKSKYGNVKVAREGLDGQALSFDSKAEAHYYDKLRLRIRAGEITGFDRQVTFELVVNGVLIARYIADFVLHHKDGSRTVVDVKGGRATKTPVFRLKQKLMRACLGIEIQIEETK